MVGRPLHRAEGRPAEAAQPAGVRFAFLEKADAKAPAAVLRQQHGLAEIEDLHRVVALLDERRNDVGRLVCERQTGRGADDVSPVEDQGDHAPR